MGNNTLFFFFLGSRGSEIDESYFLTRYLFLSYFFLRWVFGCVGCSQKYVVRSYEREKRKKKEMMNVREVQ